MTELSASLLLTDDTGDLASGTPVDRALSVSWRDAINALIHSSTNPTITPEDIIDEVVAARGGEASLSARLAAIIATLTASGDAVDVPADFGDTVTAGQAIYLSSGSGGKTPGKWYKADNANDYSSSTAKGVGFAPNAVLAGASDFARVSGRITGLSGLTTGVVYYASNTPGGLTSTPPTNAVILGVALSTTTLLIASATRIQALQALLDAAKGSATDLDTRLSISLQASGYLKDPYPKTLTHTAGTGTGTGAAPLVLLGADTTVTGSVGAGETTLQSITLPANSLDANNDTALFYFWGTVANNANNKTLKFKFGASVITVLNANPLQNYTWALVVTVVRTGAATQVMFADFTGWNGGAGFVVYNNNNVAGTENLAANVTVLLTGQATTNNDIVKNMARARVE